MKKLSNKESGLGKQSATFFVIKIQFCVTILFESGNKERLLGQLVA